ncbi:F-box/kelch-repeat protein At3g23880-like [Rhododendron vialii]|uniref:F-box/kelch-repeat protein At3g23880-like n=1 Tax=Rhododendron vialii TaxID=182163 RepID=UPI002660360E|nr:F-box/kelch-repeat protein At3g23880-like [Rhododendron vialii]
MAIERSPKRVYQRKKKRNPLHQKTDSKPLPDLPHEIIVEILSRLPVKTLMRFRCVCESWRSLISDPKFAKTHLSLASSNTDYTHRRLLLRSDDDPHDFKSCSIFSIMYERCDAAVGLDFGLDGVRIVGSCNGLVCMTFGLKTLFIWNPSTRKFRILPDIEVPWWNRCTVYQRSRFPVCGFGYDESIDDYKVVLIFQAQVNWEYKNTVAVYTSRTDSWRTIGDCPHQVNGSGKFVSGALHWIGHVEIKDIIVSFDLAKETYGEVSQPDYIHFANRYLTMEVLSGCLCMLCDYDGLGVELWVMKEYGIRESWTMLFDIYDDSHELIHGKNLSPKCISKNGDVLMVVTGRDVKGHLVGYNWKDGKIWYPKIHQCFPSFSAYPYIESLVSPCTDADSGD